MIEACCNNYRFYIPHYKSEDSISSLGFSDTVEKSMRMNKLYFLLLLGCASTNAQVQDRLAYFLRSKMDGFPAWASLRNIDPTPIRPEIGTVQYNIDNWLAVMEGEIWNLSFFGLTWEISNETTYSGTVTDQGRIRFHYFIPEAGIRGNYSISGLLFGFDGQPSPHVPASATGNFTLTCSNTLIAFDEYFSIINNTVIMRGDGATRGGTDIFLLRTESVGGDFDSLIPPNLQDFKGTIVDETMRQMTQGFGREGKKLVHGYFFDFIQSVFNETPASEIFP